MLGSSGGGGKARTSNFPGQLETQQHHESLLRRQVVLEYM